MDAHCIIIEIFNGKQTRPVSSPALNLTGARHRRCLHVYGCECGQREAAVHCCSNAGPSSLKMTYIRLASVWRLLVACADPVCCAIHSRLISLHLSREST